MIANVLAELRTGDIVLSTKGSYGMVLRGTPSGDIVKWYVNSKGKCIDKFRSLNMINSDFTFRFDEENRIVKVWRTKDKHYLGDKAVTKYTIADSFELIYEDKVKEVTMDEIEEKFGCKVKIKNSQN